MHNSSRDYIVIREQYSRRITFAGTPVIQRGLAELRPRRISHVKLGATLIRQQQHSVPTQLTSATLLMPIQSTDSNDLDRHLMDVPCLRLGPATIAAFFESIAGKSGDHIIAVISDYDKPRAETHTQFARAISSQNPALEKQLAKSMSDSLANVIGDFVPQGADRRRLVIEDRTGKSSLLNFSEQSIKLANKRWQMISGKEGEHTTRAPMEMPEGWGVASFRIQGEPDIETGSATHATRFALLSIRMAEDQINLDTGRLLRQIATDWLQNGVGFNWHALARLVVCDPWFVIARYIAMAFTPPKAQSLLTMYPDLVHGWQPIMTAAEFCINPDLPALAIFTGAFPYVHMMAAWS